MLRNVYQDRSARHCWTVKQALALDVSHDELSDLYIAAGIQLAPLRLIKFPSFIQVRHKSSGESEVGGVQILVVHLRAVAGELNSSNIGVWITSTRVQRLRYQTRIIALEG